MKAKLPKLTFRKLGRHKGKDETKVYGLSWGYITSDGWKPSGHIELDPRNTDLQQLDTAIHEVMHTENPDMHEKEVRRQTRIYSRTLWKLGFRRSEK